MIVFSCPRCEHRYTASDTKAGDKIACEACGQRVQIPPPPTGFVSIPARRGFGFRQLGLSILILAAGVVCVALLLAGIALLVLAPGDGGGDSAATPGAPSNETPKTFAPVKTPQGKEVPTGNDTPPVAGELAEKAYAILKANCYRCHGENGVAEGGVNYVLDFERLVARKKIIPGNAEKSRLYRRVKDSEMPPEEEKIRPSAADVAALRRWIEAGAPSIPTKSQGVAFTSNSGIIEQLHGALMGLPERDRRFARFFTLTHLANANLRNDELQTFRVALAKLVNSLSWNKEIVNPKRVDQAGTIYRIDIRDYQWNAKVWNLLLQQYPYGALWDHPQANECVLMTGGQLPMLRADWFVWQASRPPLYHGILQLPVTEGELEKQLHIDIADNIRQERVIRAGFNGSGVSRNNRLIERHTSPYGCYWRSYDFADNTGHRNLFAFPLGPGSDDKSFKADGGEIIFSLPNGLNAFMLINEKGQRLDKGPLNIVSDPKRPDRTVENGISCMGCHVQGFIPNKDQVRVHVEKNPESFAASEIEVIKLLYVPDEKLDFCFKQDNARFRAAVQQVAGKLTITESMTGLVAYFEQELDLTAAAAELGLKAADLSEKLAQSGPLLRVLGPLRTPGGTVQRQVFTESFPALVADLKLGTMIVPDR